MKATCQPDVSARPASATVELLMKASPEALYEAWTSRFDLWFAEPGEVLMTPEVDRAWFFRNRKDWGSHPHYGRFVELVRPSLVVTTWLTGETGTEGRETLIRVELTPQEGGTLLRMTHSGHGTQKSADGHAENWPLALAGLDEALSK